jgi:sugar lactone lactonase YvrE
MINPGQFSSPAVDCENPLFKDGPYEPSGAVMAVIDMPCAKPMSCALGGPDLSELYITSARLNLSGENLSEYPHSGDLFVLHADARGRPDFLSGA